MDLLIRAADDTDRALARRWLDSDNGPSGYLGHYGPTNDISFDSRDEAWVAIDRGDIVAYAALHEDPPHHGRLGFIVRPDRRREGIAKTFIPLLLQSVDLQAYSMLAGALPPEDIAAHKVLTTAGFHPTGYDDSGRQVFERR